MHLRIHHQTDYRYAAGVTTAQHIAHLQPPDTPWQRCTAHSLDMGPLQAAVHTHLDAFGNHCAYWAMDALHHSLTVSAHSEVHTRQASAQDASPQADQPGKARATTPNTAPASPVTRPVSSCLRRTMSLCRPIAPTTPAPALAVAAGWTQRPST